MKAVDRRSSRVGTGMAIDKGKAGENAVAFEEVFDKNYRAAQYHFVQFFTDHLADCARVFGGDMQLALVLAIIGQSTLNAFMKEGSPLPSEMVSMKNTAINASRVADVSGIPRQTVRRKLAILKERGWIEQVDSGAWRLVVSGSGAKARDDLKDLDARGIARAARFLSAMRQLS